MIEKKQMHFMTGMDHRTVRANGIKINLWTGGNGPPVLLLHGWPQTAQMWHKEQPASLSEIIAVPDYIQHAIVTFEEIEEALTRLSAGDFIGDSGCKFSPSSKTLTFYQSVTKSRRPVFKDVKQVWAAGKHPLTVKACSLLCNWAVRRLALTFGIIPGEKLLRTRRH